MRVKFNLNGIDIKGWMGYPYLWVLNPIRSAQWMEFYVMHLKDLIIALVLTGASISLIGCEETIKADPDPVTQTEESLSVEQTNPVEEITPTEERIPLELNSQEELIVTAVELDPTPGPIADNSLCLTCHLNFKKETLTLIHAQANIGCARCHGASDAHRLDEDTVTPPDVMFPKDKIKFFCMSCHTEDLINIPLHKTVMAEGEPVKAGCTDCHGEHRLNYRTRKWDKVTRNLIKDERVRKLSDEMFE